MIYIILVNFRGAQDTIECVSSLREHIEARARVIVIENGSGDSSLSTLEQWAQVAADERGYQGQHKWTALKRFTSQHSPSSLEMTIIDSGANLGFAGGCNVGIEVALHAPECTHVWLLNNDTVVKEDALRPLLARMHEDDAMGMCGSTLAYYDNPEIVQACGGVFDPWTGRGKPPGEAMQLPLPFDQRELEASLDYVVGASMLVSRRLIETTGAMSERYFLYFEEIDWAHRAAKHGFSLGWAPDSIVYHKEGASIGTSTRDRPGNLAIYFMVASYLRFLRAHKPILVPIGIILSLIRAVRWRFIGDRAASRRVLRATSSFLRSPSGCQSAKELHKAY